MKKSTVIATFNSNVQTVWDIVTNNNVVDWRSDLSKIILQKDGKSFVEVTKGGFETEFIITEKIPCERYEFDIKNNNMTGHWVGVFSVNGSGTQIEFTEEVSTKNPLMNLFIGSYLKKQQATYISDLKNVLGE